MPVAVGVGRAKRLSLAQLRLVQVLKAQLLLAQQRPN